MQDLGGNKSFDDEILAEGRLGEDQELMIYNMLLRQTSQRAAGGREGTHMLASRVEGNPTYQEMIERGLLDCKIYGQGVGAAAAVTLLVTQKGLRYCVLFAEEIEPRRAFDVAGVQVEPQAEAARLAVTRGGIPVELDCALSEPRGARPARLGRGNHEGRLRKRAVEKARHKRRDALHSA